MTIMHITGPAKSGKSLLGNALRDRAISKSKPDGITTPFGALLVDDTQTGEPRYLLEKLMDGDFLSEKAGTGPAIPREAKDIKWKIDPVVILVGDKIRLLDEFEKLAPGFTEMFGPVSKLALEAA